jgi:hypothetical protein
MGNVFSVEMKSKDHVKNMTISNEAHDRVLFEGDLGHLEEVSFIGDGMLEVRGTNGVLRVEFGQEEIEKLMRQMSEARA